MKQPDDPTESDDGLVAEDLTQQVEHIELTAEQPLPDGTDWELAAIADDLEDAPLGLVDGQPAAAPTDADDADLELFAETQFDVSQRLLQIEDEQLELAATLARERERWQRRLADLGLELATRSQQLAERDAEIANLSAQLASITLERDGLLADRRDQRASGPPPPAPDVELSAIRAMRERVHERGRALLVARDEIDRLRRERDQLSAGLAERGEFIQRLHARLREFEGGQRGGELRRLLRRFFGGDETVAELAAVPAPQPAPEPALAPPVADPGAAAAAAPPPRPAPAPPPLRRFLIGLDLPGRVHELERHRTSIGRTQDNDLRILDPTVSRLHATLKVNGAAVTVIDANSRNGVFVNGIQVRFAELQDGDLLTFGNVRFRYRVSGPGGSFDPERGS